MKLLADYGEERLRVVTQPSPGGPHDAAVFGAWAASAAASLGVECVYARHFHGAIRAAAAAIPTVMETHAHVGDRRDEVITALRSTQSSTRGIRAVITISDTLKSYFESLGAVADRVHVVPDGVDVELFAPPDMPPGIPTMLKTIVAPRITYAGHLYDYKGIPTMIEAAVRAPELSFVMLGGLPEDVERVRALTRGIANVHVLGAVPHVQVPPFLWHSDVLLLPPSASDPSAAWTSPVKLGEYLASGTPIVASSIRGLRRWVTEEHVTWCVPDDPVSMIDAIRAVLAQDPATRAARVADAAQLARAYSYPRRAARILATLGDARDQGLYTLGEAA
jgi:glycosyltransferase involved in cell wall biosynthesis